MLTDNLPRQAVEKAFPHADVLTGVSNGFVSLFRDLWTRVSEFEFICFLPFDAPEVADGLRNWSIVYTAQKALGDIGADIAMLCEVKGIGALAPVPDTFSNVLASVSAEKATNVIDCLKASGFTEQIFGTRLIQLPGNSFFARSEKLAWLAALPWEKLSTMPLQQFELLLPLAMQKEGCLLGFSLP